MSKEQTSIESTEGSLNEGGEIDFREIYQKQSADLEETKGKLGATERELAEVKKRSGDTESKVDKMRKALMGVDDEITDPTERQIKSLENEMDEYIQAGLEADKAGKPIPLTTKNAIERIKFTIDQIKENQAYKKELAEIKGKIGRLEDPAATTEKNAYSQMDNYLTSALETLYGPAKEYTQVKAAQREAVTKLVIDEIKSLREGDEDDKATWDRILRDRKAQENMVQHFIKQVIPPKARQLMDDDKIMRTPMGLKELKTAFDEAREHARSHPGDKRAQSYVKELREQILGTIHQASSGKRGIVNQLLRE